MINMYEINGYGIAFIDCGDDLDIESLSVNWAEVKVGDEIRDKDGNIVGTVSELGDRTVTVK